MVSAALLLSSSVASHSCALVTILTIMLGALGFSQHSLMQEYIIPIAELNTLTIILLTTTTWNS